MVPGGEIEPPWNTLDYAYFSETYGILRKLKISRATIRSPGDYPIYLHSLRGPAPTSSDTSSTN